MNFALDAIWWRLSNPHIRALASVLVAPALWRTGRELSVRELLGERGFRYLLDLDDNKSFRLPENVGNPLLGKYAENLLAFWLANAPHSRLLGRNIQLFNLKNQLVGELDFVAQLNGRIYHIELACKYFGAYDGQPENMVGLNSQDNLLNKIDKLNQQLNYSQNPAGQQALANLGVNAAEVQCVSVVRGMGFSHSGSLKNVRYAENAWTGVLLNHLQQIDFKNKKFYRLPKNQFLAPARVSGSLVVDWDKIGEQSGLIAEVVQRPDDYFHEIQRFMLM